MRTLIFDTETTGKTTKGPLCYQPNPVQLACLLVEGKQIYGMANLIINAGEVVPEEVVAVHGISTELVQTFGISLQAAVDLFLALVEQAERIVAHNLAFDRLIMEAAIDRATPRNAHSMKSFRRKLGVCTMLSATPILKLPGRYSDYKWPNLDETYRFLVDSTGFEGAHDALADVKACAAILEKLEEGAFRLVAG